MSIKKHFEKTAIQLVIFVLSTIFLVATISAGKGILSSAFNITDNDSNSLLYVQEDGKVGIGTTSPDEKLTVAGTIESTSGGFKFPDGSMQTSSAVGFVPKIVLSKPDKMNMNNASNIEFRPYAGFLINFDDVVGNKARFTGQVVAQSNAEVRLTIDNVPIWTSLPINAEKFHYSFDSGLIEYSKPTGLKLVEMQAKAVDGGLAFRYMVIVLQ
jgi:hypothetical protein